MVQITPGDLPHFMFRAHDNRELLRVVFLPPCPIENESGKESGEAVGLVRAD